MRKINVFTTGTERDPSDPSGYRGGMARLGPAIGSMSIGGKVYDLPAGQSICPYHYEYDEEWLLVLSGRPLLRHTSGEDLLEPGDLVCFPAGPAGAHKVTNSGDGTVRVLMLSTQSRPAVAVYPDSGKIGVFTEGRVDDVMVRRADGVGYWEGET